MNKPPKDTYPNAEKRIFQSDMKTLVKYGSRAEAAGFWEDYKQYCIMKKKCGRSNAVKNLPEDSLLRKKFEQVFILTVKTWPSGPGHSSVVLPSEQQ